MNKAGMLTIVGPLIASALLMGGCTATSSEGDRNGSTSCARRVAFDDRIYSAVANVEFMIGDRLGTGRSVSCDDTGGQGEKSLAGDAAWKPNVYEIDGLDSTAAIAVGDSSDDVEFFALDRGKGLPTTVQKFIDAS